MKFFPLAVACLTLSCISSSEDVINGRSDVSLSYFKDKRTNLCYAAMSLDRQSGILTNVPCTPEVERLIGEEKR